MSVPSQTTLIFPPVPHGSHTRSAILPRASPVPIALASRETIASRRRAIPRRHARQRTRPRSHSNFSVASHSRTSSDLPAQSHRFFLAASVCVRTSWTGCPSSTAPWSWSTRPFTSRYDTSTPSSTAEVRIVPLHPAPTAQPRVQNIHSNPKTNALEKRAGYRRLFEKISN